MKTKLITSLVLFGLITVSISASASAAEVKSEAKSETKTADKAEPKSKASAKSSPTKATKATKAKEAESDQPSAAVRAKLKLANDSLKKLTSYKKGKLTRTLNSGKKEELIALPGIGKATAAAIIEARPFESSANLILVKGVGRKTFADIVAAME